MSLVYLVVCRLLGLVVLCARGNASKELEIVVLRHEVSILRRQLPRPAFTAGDRLLLCAFSRVLPRRSWHVCVRGAAGDATGIGVLSRGVGRTRTVLRGDRRSMSGCAS